MINPHDFLSIASGIILAAGEPPDMIPHMTGRRSTDREPRTASEWINDNVLPIMAAAIITLCATVGSLSLYVFNEKTAALTALTDAVNKLQYQVADFNTNYAYLNNSVDDLRTTQRAQEKHLDYNDNRITRINTKLGLSDSN